MIVPVSHRTKQVILKDDPGRNGGVVTQFTIQTLGARAKAFVQNALAALGPDGKTPEIRNGSYMLAAVAAGVSDWDRIEDGEGKEIKPNFVRREGVKVLSDESLDVLAEHINELGALVLQYNGLSEADEGNSETSPATPPAS